MVACGCDGVAGQPSVNSSAKKIILRESSNNY